MGKKVLAFSEFAERKIRRARKIRDKAVRKKNPKMVWEYADIKRT